MLSYLGEPTHCLCGQVGSFVFDVLEWSFVKFMNAYDKWIMFKTNLSSWNGKVQVGTFGLWNSQVILDYLKDFM